MKNLTIAAAVSSTIQLIETGQKIYMEVANLMDAAEKQGGAGGDKKAWVLAYAAKEIKEVLENADEWLPRIKQWIDAFKAAFNALKALF